MTHFALFEDESISENVAGSTSITHAVSIGDSTPASESPEEPTKPPPLCDASEALRGTSTEVTFSSLGVSPMLAQLLNQYTITVPTDIQQKSLPYTMQGRDFVE